jgi:hypothetical protein
MQTYQTIVLGVAIINMVAGLWAPKQTKTFFMCKDAVLFTLAFLVFLIGNIKITQPKEDLLYRETIEKSKLVRITF